MSRNGEARQRRVQVVRLVPGCPTRKTTTKFGPSALANRLADATRCATPGPVVPPNLLGLGTKGAATGAPGGPRASLESIELGAGRRQRAACPTRRSLCLARQPHTAGNRPLPAAQGPVAWVASPGHRSRERARLAPGTQPSMSGYPDMDRRRPFLARKAVLTDTPAPERIVGHAKALVIGTARDVGRRLPTLSHVKMRQVPTGDAHLNARGCKPLPAWLIGAGVRSNDGECVWSADALSSPLPTEAAWTGGPDVPVRAAEPITAGATHDNHHQISRRAPRRTGARAGRRGRPIPAGIRRCTAATRLVHRLPPRLRQDATCPGTRNQPVPRPPTPPPAIQTTRPYRRIPEVRRVIPAAGQSPKRGQEVGCTRTFARPRSRRERPP